MKKYKPQNTGFFVQVYALVEQIPPGKVMTYGQISHMLKRPHGAKFVGFAMASAPDHAGLPCHRVVNRLGGMAPGMIFGGEAVQREKLAAEGVPFLENGRVDLAEALFDPGEIKDKEKGQ